MKSIGVEIVHGLWSSGVLILWSLLQQVRFAEFHSSRWKSATNHECKLPVVETQAVYEGAYQKEKGSCALSGIHFKRLLNRSQSSVNEF